MSSVVVVDHVYKSYKLPSQLEINRIFQWAGKQLKQQQAPARREGHQYVLKDVSFSLDQRESLGLIGSNGAGKTTLFRLLSGITLPTRGRVRVQGRVSSLISLGAGFHPDLSGRENLYLNCALMGLSYKQTSSRIDQIIEFAEIGDYIDLAIKRYSSGMLARLGFSVAVHLDPELILIDEVLSVGDYRFQVKSTAAIRDFMSRGTVILISHDLKAVERLCSRTIWLNQGEIQADGPSTEIISEYIEAAQRQILDGNVPSVQHEDSSTETVSPEFRVLRQIFDEAVFTQEVEVHNRYGKRCYEFSKEEPIGITCHLTFAKPTTDVNIIVGIVDIDTQVVVVSCDSRFIDQPDTFYGNVLIDCELPNLNLRPRRYGVFVELSNYKALMPLSIWKDIDTRFVIIEPGASAQELSPQAGLIYAQDATMRIAEMTTILSKVGI